MAGTVLEAIRDLETSVLEILEDCDFVQINRHPMKVLICEGHIQHVIDQIRVIKAYIQPPEHDIPDVKEQQLDLDI